MRNHYVVNSTSPLYRRRRLRPEEKTEILRLHGTKMSNVNIARAIGRHSHTIDRFVFESGLKSWGKLHLEITGINKARCSKCHEIKDLDGHFPIKVQGSTNRLSYCKECANKLAYQRIKTPELYFARMAAWIKAKCKVVGIPFDNEINGKFIKDIFEKQNGKCFYTDVEMIAEINKGHFCREAASLDRIIPEKGYMKNNVVLCTRKANAIKNDITLEEMALWMPGWYNRAKKFTEEYR